MLDNLDHLRQAATWARALTWPVEVSDARLGKTATSFMELATPDVVLALIEQNRVLTEQVKTLQADPNSWQSGYDRGREMGGKLALGERDQLRARELRYLVPVAPDDLVRVNTADVTGRALAWLVLQPQSDQPKTFGCNHNMPTCSQCEGLVRSWLAKELGETVEVPTEFARS